MTETVLVTGGTGFVAGWCIVELLRRGYAVRTTVRSLAKEPAVRTAIASVVDAGDRLTVFAADLTQDEGWHAAMTGCDYVLHVASPLGIDNSQDREALTIPAREGALRVLRAATNARVKRVVMTSAAAVATPPLQDGDSLSDETVWFDPSEPNVDAYRQSKRLAERAAWDFVRANDIPTALTTILPGAVFGPVLTVEKPGSVQVIGRLMQGRVPANPRLGFEVIDVRDLADVHIRAMTSAGAAGERFLAVGEFMWMSDISRTLRAQLGKAASKVPTRTLPDFVFRLMALFDPSLRAMTPRLGRKHRHTSAKARELLGWQPRPAAITLADCARSLMPGGTS
jgi:dihydroflavonol-4-reductase